MNPMTVDEVSFQMQLPGHSFFMFLNTESNEYSLLCQRDDGDLGMISQNPTDPIPEANNKKAALSRMKWEKRGLRLSLKCRIKSGGE